MDEVNTWYFLKNYIRDHKKIIIFFIMALMIFVVIIGLYKLPLSAVGYAALLCLLPATFLSIYDFVRYKKTNEELMVKVLSINKTLDGLPAAKTLIENNYSELLFLSQSERLAQKARANTAMNEMIDYYTMWAHQIKTPISGMRLMLQLSENDIAANVRKEMSNELFKIEQYVGLVLSYMRLENDSTDYLIREYNLDKIIKQNIKKFSTQFINKKLSMDFEETGIKAITDEKWLGIALDQIISNAIKYTEDGVISIRGSVTPDEDLLTIEDTGIGIAEEDLPRVFEKGYTGYNGRIEKRSTGIGLFLTKRILNKLGHSIIIESVPDKGTKVTLALRSRHIIHE